MDFLIRRLYKLVARSTGHHVSEEIAGFLEHVARYSKKKEKEKLVATKFPYLTANLQGTSAELLKSPPSITQEPPLNLLSSPSTQEKEKEEIEIVQQPQITQDIVIEPTTVDSLKPVPIPEMKSFLRRIENISTMQSTALNKRGLAFKYFTKFSSHNLNQSSSKNNHHIQPHQESSVSGGTNNFKVSAIPRFADVDIEQVEQTSGLLSTEMRLIENQIDSDATASSTGGESADEMIVYNNGYQQPLSM
jgi:KAT8 regulatory NSL complex subunit 1